MTYLIILATISGILAITAILLAASCFDHAQRVRKKFRHIFYIESSNIADYSQLIDHRCRQWLLCPPAVLAKAPERFQITEAIIRLFTKGHFRYSWPEMFLTYAFINSPQRDDRDALIKYLEKWVRNYQNNKPALSPDLAAFSYALAGLEFQRYPLFDEMTKAFAEWMSGFSGKPIPYRIQKNGNSLFLVDTIGMLLPSLLNLGTTFQKPELITTAYALVDDFYDHAYPDSFDYPLHGYCEKDGAIRPVGITGWGRGIGWLFYGLAESFDMLRDGIYKEKSVASHKGLFRGTSHP